MAWLLHALETTVHHAAWIGIGIAELTGIGVLIFSAVRGVVLCFRHDVHLRLKLAQGIALALEFKLGGEVLRTVVVREWTELLVLGAVIGLRGVLTLLLHWEIRIEERRENH